jgi:dextranase
VRFGQTRRRALRGALIASCGGVLLIGAACAQRRADDAPSARRVRVEVVTDAARYAPGRRVRVTVRVAGGAARGGSVALRVTHLGAPVGGVLRAGLGSRGRTLVWRPPGEDYRGYLLRADVTDARGRRVGRGYSAADVSSDSARFARYGFVSGFGPGVRVGAVAGFLRRYHLTDIQFYDWQSKHHVPLAGSPQHPAAAWKDIAERPTERRTVLALIDRVHAAGGDALNYNLVYGADEGYGADGSGVDPGWGLYRRSDCSAQDDQPLPAGWAAGHIFVMDPANPGWQGYLTAKERDVFAAYPFDGLQADQLGARGALYTCGGEPVDLAGRVGPWIDALATGTNKKIVFNAVGQFGQQQVAADAHLPYLYTEAWPRAGQRTYADLKRVIDDNRTWGAGKTTVLAAYLNRSRGAAPGHFNAPGVLTVDAAIFAAGGAHNELGDVDHLLSNEYYPNHNLRMGPALGTALRHYYDFLVAYENLLRDPDIHDDPATTVIPGVRTSADGRGRSVWTMTRRTGDTEVLHLINLLGNRSTSWVDTNGTRAAPRVLRDRTVRHYYRGDRPSQVMLASPDRDGGQAHRLPFSTGHDHRGTYVQFRLPTLNYWDMVWMR